MVDKGFHHSCSLFRYCCVGRSAVLEWQASFGDTIDLVPWGLAIILIGVVGLYSSKVFIDTGNRQPTIVRAVHDLVAGGIGVLVREIVGC